MDLKSVSELGGLLTLLENLIARDVDGWLGELSCPSLRIIAVCAWGKHRLRCALNSVQHGMEDTYDHMRRLTAVERLSASGELFWAIPSFISALQKFLGSSLGVPWWLWAAASELILCRLAPWIVTSELWLRSVDFLNCHSTSPAHGKCTALPFDIPFDIWAPSCDPVEKG